MVGERKRRDVQQPPKPNSVPPPATTFEEEATSGSAFLKKAQRIFMYIGVAYVIGILLLTIPPIQRQVIYLHNVRWPLWAHFDAPHYHGLAPFKTVPLRITTPDSVDLGAWFVLSEPAYRATERAATPTSDDVKKALKDYPTVVFFHGNAASRAVKYRVQFYGQVTARLGANVLAIDYRGFGDSSGTPTEAGLNIDSRAAWDWLLANGADPSNIIIIGQSLGSGVAAKLVSQLAQEGVSPRAVALTAPFSSIGKLLDTYSFGGYFPLLRPLQSIPFAPQLIPRFIHTRFSTIDLISDIKCPILLVHAKNDMTIPSSHSFELFEKIMDPYLPAWPFEFPTGVAALSLTLDQIKAINEFGFARRTKAKEIAPEVTIGDEEKPFGVIRQLDRSAEGRGKVVYLQTEKGGHSEIVRWEGVIDWLGKIAGL